MSVPTFYILELDSLTPDFYNDSFINSIDEEDNGEAINHIDFDCNYGSVNDNHNSYIFDMVWNKIPGLCEAVDNCLTKEKFKSYLKANSISDFSGYSEVFYKFATIPDDAYIVALRENKYIIGIGHFVGKLYYDANNRPYNKYETIREKSAPPLTSNGKKRKGVISNVFKEVKIAYPYCRKIKWIKVFDNNNLVLRDEHEEDFTIVKSVNSINMLQNLLESKDDALVSQKNTMVQPAQTIDKDYPVIPCPFAHNRIIFGAPGTGKSYLLEEQRKKYFASPERYERVTFHPDYCYANFVGTYKPVMVEHGGFEYKDEAQKKVISILTDKSKTAQEKYDLLYDDFKDNSLTRLPILVGIYSDGTFKTKKVDESYTNNNNDVERNHGKAIRPYLNLNFDDEARSEISYEYVPGPFMRIYVEALKHPDKCYLLAIEEINRANVAAVFGDVFQLLDRDDDGNSMYPIHASEDMKRYIAKELGEEPKKFASIRIPSNMYIWATMNSADQGVFPMDTAFKRRWEFEYIGINTSEQQMSHYNVQLGQGEYAKIINWNELRRAINEELVCMNVNEDKLMGPFFLSDKVMKTLAVGPEDNAAFIHAFKNKVLMYLFDDAAKQKRATLFNNVEKAKLTYSSLCEEFDQKGVAIFCDNIANRFINPDNEEQ